jgi:catalase-peroxidase
MGLGWKSDYKSGKGSDTISSGIEGAWTPTPTKWDSTYLDVLFGYEWELGKGPAGAHQWYPIGLSQEDHAPDAEDAQIPRTIMMTTADMAMKVDPEYRKIAQHFHANPNEFADAFSRAWFKLTHRDMGPKVRYLGTEVPEEDLLWQDPLPPRAYDLIDSKDLAQLKENITNSCLTTYELVYTAWSSASTFRGSDARGGANGARIRLAPQKDWEVNQPAQLKKVLATLESIQNDFNQQQSGNKQVSLADLIVLGGNVGIENAAKKGGYDKEVPFTAGRVDATLEQTDVESFTALEPVVDGFRNYSKRSYSVSQEELLIDKAQLLTLTAPQMTVLVGGMRAMGINYGNSKNGIFTSNQGALSNDYFVKLLDDAYSWNAVSNSSEVFESDLGTASRVDLVFGSNSQLRAVSEVYASEDAEQKFIDDFIAAWVKVMEADRFDL